MGYLAGALPTLETACCQAAEAHSQELADALTGSDRQADRQRTPIKKELMGAAGASNAACTVLVSSIASVCLQSLCLWHALQFLDRACACLSNPCGRGTMLLQRAAHGHIHVAHMYRPFDNACLLRTPCIFELTLSVLMCRQASACTRRTCSRWQELPTRPEAL